MLAVRSYRLVIQRHDSAAKYRSDAEFIGGVAHSYTLRFHSAARRNKNNGLGRWQVLCVAVSRTHSEDVSNEEATGHNHCQLAISDP